ncbi:MAG: ABC transporter ATP-binding protein [Arcanobacterium sp.]|nr:ABC transporter ATP-binding protein [Arcanobacterium sp.]
MNSRSVLEAQSLNLSYGENRVVENLNLVLPKGQITSIIGGNGCGKSTLLRSFARLLLPEHGTVLFNGEVLAKYHRKDLAKQLAILPQSPIAPPGITVADLVGRGRSPHLGLFGNWSKADYEAVAKALEKTRLTDLADRVVDELSGGQRQRVWIAMALAQDTQCVLLDEPTTYLDVANQLEVLDLLIELNRDQGATIVMVLHDMNLAARYSDNIVALRSGELVAMGSPEEVITAENMRKVFDIECRVVQDSGAPVVLPYGRYHG